MQPPEDRGEDEALPRLETNVLAGELALNVWAEFNELTDALSCGKIETVRERRIIALSTREIIQLALAGEAHPFARRDLAGEHLADVVVGVGNVGRGIRFKVIGFYEGRGRVTITRAIRNRTIAELVATGSIRFCYSVFAGGANLLQGSLD